MTTSKLLLYAFLLINASCAVNQGSSNRYFDYSGRDGCNPPNIGHRLGGDLAKLADNSIQGIKGIAAMQKSPCFKNWEFDLNQAYDAVVLVHDSTYRGTPIVKLRKDELPKDIVDTTEFAKKFAQINIIKPVIIDLKYMPSESSWFEAKQLAKSIRSKHQVEVWFLTSKQQALNMKGICSVMNGEFDIMLYRRGGKHC